MWCKGEAGRREIEGVLEGRSGIEREKKEEERKKKKFYFFFFKQKTAYEIYQCDWSSDVCSSDLGTSLSRN